MIVAPNSIGGTAEMEWKGMTMSPKIPTEGRGYP